MEDLMHRIRALPGMPMGEMVYPGGWVSRAEVLTVIEDYLIEHSPGTMEVKGCTREEFVECLRVFEKERDATGRGMTVEETIGRLESVIRMLDLSIAAKKEEPRPFGQLTITVQPNEMFKVDVCSGSHGLTIYVRDADKVLNEVRTFVERHLGSWQPARERWSLAPNRARTMTSHFDDPGVTMSVQFPVDFSFKKSWDLLDALENAIRDFDR